MNTVRAERVLPTTQTIQIVQGDLTAETTDAIVHAANAHLQHGAGVAGAIVRGGGPAVQQESDAWVRAHGPVSHARPAWTTGGRLQAKYVIHAVGPVWTERGGDPASAEGDGDADAKLASAVQGSLQVADELMLASISMPAISTGIFGFPKERAARVMLATIEEYFAKHQSALRLIRLVLFDESTIEAFMAAWDAA